MAIRHTKESLGPLVQKVTSIRQLIEQLGLQQSGGNYTHLYKTLKKLDIDYSHFTGQGWRKGRTFHSRPVTDYLSNKFPIQSDTLKKRLLKEGYFKHECCKCQKSAWFDLPIPLELHHIDCNHSNNNLDNLTILCPNCHAYVHKKATK